MNSEKQDVQTNPAKSYLSGVFIKRAELANERQLQNSEIYITPFKEDDTQSASTDNTHERISGIKKVFKETV